MRRVLSYVWWPALFVASTAAAYFTVTAGYAVTGFNITYVALAIAIALLERAMPHETLWLKNDGQIVPDIAHTLLSKGVAQVVVVLITFMGLAELFAPTGGGWWPQAWPACFPSMGCRVGTRSWLIPGRASNSPRTPMTGFPLPYSVRLARRHRRLLHAARRSR